MAPAPTYDPPHQQLGRLMVVARRRGLSFDDFWREAMAPAGATVMVTTERPPVGAVLWPTDRADRVNWQAALAGAKDGWRRAYERLEPTPEERALTVLGEAMGWIPNARELDAPLRGDGGERFAAA